MLEERQPPAISYHEYRVIARLLRAHADEHQSRLRGMVAFGDLITRGDSFDIDILELVEGWDGARFARFSGPADPPLRGELRLYILTPEVFEDPALIEDHVERPWVEDLLARVRQGYEIIMEIPPGWVARVLNREEPVHASLTAPPSGSLELGDPYQVAGEPSSGCP
jgi:hypothetical protein